jgi:hypothetical protein
VPKIPASESAEPGKSEPITIGVVSARGPFARGTIALRTARAPIRNGSAGQVVVVGACVSPLVEERTQLAIPGGALAAQVAAGTLAAGEAAMVEIGGAVPARPGSYMAHLDVRCDGVTLSTLVRANVAASAVWGIGCMMLGLLLLGVLMLMTGEGDAQERTREALRTRGEIHAAWQRNPPPQSRRAEVAEIDYDLDEAVRTLARPRGFSVVDRRLADSGELLTAGREAAAKLRDAMAKEPPGTAEVAELAREWNDFQNDLRSLAVPDVGAAGAAGLVGHAAVLLNRAWTQLVGLRVQAAATELGAQFGRVRLVQAAGETPKAQEMAIATRGWLRRYAHDLEDQRTLLMRLKLISDGVALADLRVRRLASSDALPPERRTALLARLDTADAALATGMALQDLVTANRIVSETETEAMREQSAALVAQVERASEAAGKELSVDTVGAEFAKIGLINNPTVAQKAAIEAHAMEIWRGLLGVVHDDAARGRMQAALDAGGAAAARQDLEGLSQWLHAMQHEWTDYQPRHIAAAAALVVAPVCRDWRDRSLQQLAATQSEVELQSGGPEVTEWERQLDHARRALLAVVPEASDCLDKIEEGAGEVIAVSQAAFVRVLEDVPIPLQTRLDAAENSGVADAVAVVRRLMMAPRDLKFSPRTTEVDRVVGQPILFALANLDPNWGTSVAVTIDWGDDATLATNAERLRQGEPLEHRYTDVATRHPVATARDGAAVVGHGETEVFVRPSPATAAEQLADTFLTAQFGLALLIASVIYYWRFHTGSLVFGASTFHYVQAFSLGFAAYAAVADLPKILADHLPFK